MIGRGEAGLANAAATAPSIFRPAQSVALEIVVNAPIREEIFWRGLVLRRLAAIIGFWPALVISALPFGMVHLGGEPTGFLGAYAAGIGLGAFYSPFWGNGSMAMTMVASHAIQRIGTPTTPTAELGYVKERRLSYHWCQDEQALMVATVRTVGGTVVGGNAHRNDVRWKFHHGEVYDVWLDSAAGTVRFWLFT
jgi:hypothetical protein